MSQTTWTTSGASKPGTRTAENPILIELPIAPLRATAYRVIEAQHIRVTRRWVRDDSDQGLLEDLLDTAKPAPPSFEDADGNRFDLSRHHYLLCTPFRYRPPLRGGTRFGGAMDPPVWYAAEDVATALAERSFHLLREYTRAPGVTAPSLNEWADFNVGIQTKLGVDLYNQAFDPDRLGLESKTDYQQPQSLARVCRAQHVQTIRFRSARDPEQIDSKNTRGKNLAVLAPTAFATHDIDLTTSRTWSVIADRQGVRIARKNTLSLEPAYRFNAEVFHVEGAIPDPA